MARRSIPYPPSPTDYPDELTRPGHGSALEIAGILGGTFFFLFIYLGLIVGCLALIIVMMTSLHRLPYPALWVLASIPAAGFAFLLIKGLFAYTAPDKNMHLEIEEEDQPIFFAFLRRLTDEVGAPMPNKVFVSPEVNAAAMQEVSLLNLVLPPKRNLLVGLGLVNSLNLSEFKAVMGHEFGHFSQKTSRVHTYAYVAGRVMMNLINGEDWLDRWIQSVRRRARMGNAGLFSAIVVLVVGTAVWCVRWLVAALYNLINFAALSLSRKNEFHADRIAVSVAGSNAIVHSLYRLKFAEESLAEAVRQLEVAAQHKLYTRDMFFHHSTAAAYIRKVKKKPNLGLPPELKGPKDGRDIYVFREDEDDEDDIPEMWSTHPKNFDREENAKEIFVPAEIDDRSPWTLFREKESLRERATYRFYRVAFKVKKDTELCSADEVQGFIDDEHAEITYDPKYHGAYDERPINPGNVEQLNRVVGDDPWDAERITRVHSRLYRELGNHVEDLADVRKRIRKIYKVTYGRPRGRDRDRVADLEDDFKKLIEWFTSFDRRVYLVHAHMAKQLGGQRLQELASRYLFQQEIQEIHHDVAAAQEQVDDILEGVQHYGEELPEGFFEEMQEVLRNGRQVVDDSVNRARSMLTPEMANIKMGTRLDKLIFEGEIVKELPQTFIKGAWVTKLVNQLGMLRQRVNRMDFKSFGAILQMQDRMAAEWLAKSTAPAAKGEGRPDAVVADDGPAPAVTPPPMPKRG